MHSRRRGNVLFIIPCVHIGRMQLRRVIKVSVLATLSSIRRCCEGLKIKVMRIRMHSGCVHSQIVAHSSAGENRKFAKSDSTLPGRPSSPWAYP